MSHGSAPSSSGLRYRSITCLVTSGESAALPSPTSPLSVKISTSSQPWKVNVPIVALDSMDETASMGLVQKWGGSGTVRPVHWMARVRISVIFMGVGGISGICEFQHLQVGNDETDQ